MTAKTLQHYSKKRILRCTKLKNMVAMDLFLYRLTSKTTDGEIKIKMATYAIGNSRWYDPFLRLLELVNFDSTVDKIWTTGDLVNRGDHSLEILRFFKT
jgi:hypothetical protein